MGITVKKIIELLKIKHSLDLVIEECKTGATWYNFNCSRLDLIAIKRSWKHPNIYGYEIKTSRGDFINDEKWKSYISYCNSFYFVAPPGIIDKNELPPEAGLIITSKNGNKLFKKKNAPLRSIDKIENIMNMFQYILICRSKIVKYNKEMENREYWEKWLEEKDESKELGYKVSKKIKILVNERITKIRVKNEKLEKENERYKFIYDFLRENGFDDYSIKAFTRWDIKNKLKEILIEKKTGIPGGFKEALILAIKQMTIIRELIDKNEKTFG